MDFKTECWAGNPDVSISEDHNVVLHTGESPFYVMHWAGVKGKEMPFRDLFEYWRDYSGV